MVSPVTHQNRAAYLTGPKVYPYEVKTAPYTAPKPDEIVIRNGAVAINPADYIKQDVGNMYAGWVKYSCILGSDVAGEVVEVGTEVTRFKVGDRVVGNAAFVDEKRNNSSEGGFQLYTVLLEHMSSPIPDDMTYERACVIPLGLSTAACALFQDDQLALNLPSQASKNRPSSEKDQILVWGGSTSVGSNAIQLAVAAGYQVVTTCSPRNFSYCQGLGASQCFDYNSPTVVKEITSALKGKNCVGAISIGEGSAEACMAILPNTEGRKFIAMATYPMRMPQPGEMFPTVKLAANFVAGSTKLWFQGKTCGIGSKFIFGTTLIHNGVGKAIYEDFLPGALAKGSFVPSPEPLVAGHGLEEVQKAQDILKKGVSAKKVVVSLEQA